MKKVEVSILIHAAKKMRQVDIKSQRQISRVVFSLSIDSRLNADA